MGIGFVRRQAKVPQVDHARIAGTHHVFRLDISMIDPQAMTVLYGVKNLHKDRFYLLGLVFEHVLLCDRPEQVSPSVKTHDDVDKLLVAEASVKRDHVRVLGDQLVDVDFALLKTLFVGSTRMLQKTLHSVVCWVFRGRRSI